MKKLQSKVILELTKKLHNFFGPEASCGLQVSLKLDQSFVTEIDLFVSQLLKEELQAMAQFSSHAFFSEEDFSEYQFPCAILDPIDGTRELIKGRPECAVSLALMKGPEINHPENYAWLYNPFSGFSLDSSAMFVSSSNKSSQKLLGLVSRSEFHKGLYKNYLKNSDVDFSPRGSIAFKLGLLASGACDFVMSLAPKNVWDIAAGTLLCEQRGIHFYQDGVRVHKLEHATYGGTLIWAHPELEQRLSQVLGDKFQK